MTGVDVTTGNPLIISGEDFYDFYEETIKQGYYLDHDFEIIGAIPDYTTDTSPQTSDPSGSDSQTPGFTIILFLGAILFIVYNKKHR